jgi:hypothetical protein
MKGKKGAIQVVAVILALTLFTVCLVSLAQRECNSNRDCPGNAYCNTKHECVEYPENIVVKESNWLPASLIIAVGLIGSAYVFKKGKLPFIKKKER